MNARERSETGAFGPYRRCPARRRARRLRGDSRPFRARIGDRSGAMTKKKRFFRHSALGVAAMLPYIPPCRRGFLANHPFIEYHRDK
ncbi:hypothetical protein [Lysobacter sp. Root983]|uniref:hypothetical protein n=1 Tax=Lysobacter sp. Root983 TaxID=1736613 RepID=UPI0012F9D2A2|nr:hypothetical protein [Lysobacter sp. Root983]